MLSDIEFISVQYKILPLLVTLGGAFLSYFLYRFEMDQFYAWKKIPSIKKVYHFFNKKWYFDRIYNEFIAQKSLDYGYHYFYRTIDRGLIEKIGPFGIVNSIL